MGNTRNTGYLQNIVQYDASNNITLPANLTVTGTITGYATTSYVGTQLGGYVPSTRTISINGTSLDLSANRSFTINSMVYPGAGIAVSTGTAWGTSLTDNSSNWNTAYGWGNHAGLYSLLNHTHTFASLTSKPTTLVGYGITDAATSAQGTSADTAYGWGNHGIAGYLTGITSGQVTTALGFTPYNATNPSGYITTAALSTYATQSYVGTQIANLVASSPAALDTLNELAAALGNDAAFSTTVSTALGNRLRVDINTQGLSATQQGYGRTNLGLGTAATSNTGDFVAYRTFGTAANNNTGDFAAASHTHSIANVTGLQTALDGKQASGSYAASVHTHIISDVTGLQTALDGKQASLGYTPYNATNPSGYISSYTETDTLASVTSRGNTTSSALYLSGAVNIYNTDSNDFRLYYQGAASGSARVYYHQPSNQLRIYATAITTDATAGIGSLALYNGTAYKIVLTEGNVSSYAVPLGRTLTINGTAYDLNADRSWTISTSAAWTSISSGIRENYNLGFRPADNSSSYAGFSFGSPGNDGNAGYFLVRGGSDNDVYTQNGLTIVADLGWLTLAQRTIASKGVRIMTGTTSVTRVSVTDGSTAINNTLAMGGNMITYTSYDTPNMIVAGNGDTNWTFGAAHPGSEYWMQVKFYGTGDDSRGFRVLDASDGTVRFRVNGAGNAYVGGNLVLHSGNYTSYVYSQGTSDGRYVRKDTNSQFLRPYYEYGNYLTSEAPSTLVSQMNSSGGVRVDFAGASYTAHGDWGHILTFSGYNRYSMSQIQTNYYTTDARLYYRQTSLHSDSWLGWKEFVFTSGNTPGIMMSGPIRRASHSSGFFEGSYNNIGGNSAYSNPIYTIGSAYNPSDSSLGSMYGIGYAHPNFWGAGKTTSWGMYCANGGVINVTLGEGSTSIWAQNDIVAYSDIRVKDNIEVIDNALEKVQKIRGVTFTRKDATPEDSHKRHAGVIAQEVLTVLPEVVSGTEQDMYSVAYGNMAGLFIEAIKELKAENDSQKTEIDKLKDLVKQLINK